MVCNFHTELAPAKPEIPYLQKVSEKHFPISKSMYKKLEKSTRVAEQEILISSNSMGWMCGFT